jgi:C-terminal processing protease CtpA/Prc
LVDAARNAVLETNAVPMTSSAILDENYGYIRVTRVGARLPEEFASSLEKLAATNKLKGLVVDLRFAGGSDYASAASVADRFLASEQPLLDWGQGVVKSTDKTNAFRLPVAVLVNQFTSGAAEALAAALRQTEVALLIGTNTAGQASMTKDFPLSTGQTLRVAVSPVRAGSGVLVERLQPDIQVTVKPEDERTYFADIYRVPSKAGMTSAATDLASLALTNKPPRKRLNEAELVRMLREGERLDDETAKATPGMEAVKPAIADPVLARAVDLLKALAVVRRTRS